jgi:hypothetical protein
VVVGLRRTLIAGLGRILSGTAFNVCVGIACFEGLDHYIRHKKRPAKPALRSYSIELQRFSEVWIKIISSKILDNDLVFQKNGGYELLHKDGTQRHTFQLTVQIFPQFE